MGRIDLSHRHRLRVIYAHTDRMNTVYYSRYFEYFEAARSALLRRIEAPYAELEKDGYLLPVVESHCHYHRAATFEDTLVIETRVDDEPKVKIRLDYTVRKEGEEAPVATGYTIHSFVDSSFRPVRAPAPFLEALRRHAGKHYDEEPLPL